MKSEQVSLSERLCCPDVGRWSSFHHCRSRTEKSCDFSEQLCLLLATAVPVQCSLWAVWSDQCLEVDGWSSVNGLEDQHHRLESDVGHNRRPVEVIEEAGHKGEFGKSL